MSYISSSINSIEKHCDYNKERTAEQLTISPTATAWFCSELMKCELERRCSSTLSVPNLGKTREPDARVFDAQNEVLLIDAFALGRLSSVGTLNGTHTKEKPIVRRLRHTSTGFGAYSSLHRFYAKMGLFRFRCRGNAKKHKCRLIDLYCVFVTALLLRVATARTALSTYP